MQSDPQKKPPRNLFIRAILNLAALLAVLAAFLFLPAGRLDWPEAWLFISVYGVLLLVYLFWGVFKDPDQLMERSRSRRRSETTVKKWDRIIMALYTALLPLLLVLTALDAGRFHWSQVSMPFKIGAWAVLLMSGVWVIWVLVTNTYLSAMARIQQDRGQTVIDKGPYRFMRHPMYLGIILMFTCLPPALGSCWGMLTSLMIDVLFILRTALEDRMLSKELEGYEDYTRRVRWRLLPGIW